MKRRIDVIDRTPTQFEKSKRLMKLEGTDGLYSEPELCMLIPDRSLISNRVEFQIQLILPWLFNWQWN